MRSSLALVAALCCALVVGHEHAGYAEPGEHDDERRDQPLTLAGIAAQAGVTPRALQHAFRRQYDTVPMSYLRQVRLERAHQDLLAADPAAGHTVAAIARRWGFTRADRFAAAYRTAYGRPPSHTLRR